MSRCVFCLFVKISVKTFIKILDDELEVSRNNSPGEQQESIMVKLLSRGGSSIAEV